MACRKLVPPGTLGKFVRVVCMGPPTQHMGLPGRVPHFHGNLQASGSGLCGELQGYFTWDKRNFCLVSYFSEDTFPFLAWEGFR